MKDPARASTVTSQADLSDDKEANKTARRDEGLINAPKVRDIQGPRDNSKNEAVSDAVDVLLGEKKFDFPYHDVDPGHGMWLEIPAHKNADQVYSDVLKSVEILNNHYSVIAKDKDGNDILDVVVTKIKLRNPDGTIKMTGDGKEAYEANHTQEPKRIQIRQYVVVVRDGGVLVARLF